MTATDAFPTDIPLFRWERIMHSDQQPVLRITEALPQLSSLPGRSRSWERYYRHMAQLLEQRWKSVLYRRAVQAFHQTGGGGAFQPWQASLQIRPSLLESDLVSVYAEIAEWTGGPFWAQTCRGDTWRLTDGAPKPLADFLDQQARKHSVLTAALCRCAAEHQAQGQRFYPRLPRRLGAALRRDQFFLVPGGLCFFFPQGSIAPPEDGIPLLTLLRCPGKQFSPLENENSAEAAKFRQNKTINSIFPIEPRKKSE